MSIKVQYNFYWKMIDFSRTFCDLHPSELISNFCSRCTSPPTQNSATSAPAPPASAPPPKPPSSNAPPPTTKTSALPTPKCRNRYALASPPSNNKNKE